VILMFVGLFYTEAPIYGWDKFLRFVTITTLAIFSPIFLLTNIKKFHRFLYTLVFISSLMAMESIVFHWSEDGFHAAFGSNYLTLGRMTGMVSLVVIYYFLLKNNNLKTKILWFCLFGLNFFGLLFGGGRAPVIAFFATVIILGLISLSSKIKTNQVKIIKITGGFILIGILFFLFSPELFSTLLNRIEVLFTQELGGESVVLRLDFYSSAIEAFMGKPLQGLGTGGFSVYYLGSDQRSYPHNILLEIGAEIGIIGLISFFFLFGFCFLYLLKLERVYKKQEKYYLIVVLLALLVFMFLNALVSGDINDNRLFFAWLGVVYAIGVILKKENLLTQDK